MHVIYCDIALTSIYENSRKHLTWLRNIHGCLITNTTTTPHLEVVLLRKNKLQQVTRRFFVPTQFKHFNGLPMYTLDSWFKHLHSKVLQGGQELRICKTENFLLHHHCSRSHIASIFSMGEGFLKIRAKNNRLVTQNVLGTLKTGLSLVYLYFNQPEYLFLRTQPIMAMFQLCRLQMLA